MKNRKKREVAKISKISRFLVSHAKSSTISMFVVVVVVEMIDEIINDFHVFRHVFSRRKPTTNLECDKFY